MQQYYEHWGWIDFLSEIAKTKIFDKQGSNLNSIECAKKTKAYDVLVYASNEKEKNAAIKTLYKK